MNHYKIWLSCVCVSILMSAHSRALFGFGTSDATISAFIPANSVDSMSVALVQSAMNILWWVDNGTISTNTINSQALLSYNIIWAVQNSNKKTQVVDQYIKDLNQSSSLLSQISQWYQSRITQAQSKLSTCTISKKSSDAEVIEAINNDSLGNIDKLIQASVQAGTCETEQSIIINSLTLIVNKYTKISISLNTKASLIDKYRPVIIQYPDIIADPEIIAEITKASIQF